MYTNSLKVRYQRGLLPLMTLSLLRRRDMYGYELVQEMARISNGQVSTQEGSLYPILYRFVEQGFISDHQVPAGKRIVRVYYHLEPDGLEYLNALLGDFRDFIDGVFQILQNQTAVEEPFL